MRRLLKPASKSFGIATRNSFLLLCVLALSWAGNGVVPNRGGRDGGGSNLRAKKLFAVHVGASGTAIVLQRRVGTVSVVRLLRRFKTNKVKSNSIKIGIEMEIIKISRILRLPRTPMKSYFWVSFWSQCWPSLHQMMHMPKCCVHT